MEGAWLNKKAELCRPSPPFHVGSGRGSAPPPPSPKKLDEARVAVGLVVLLFEGAFVELLEAEGADKVLRVELARHGCDAAAGDGLLAARTERAPLLVVVDLAEGAAAVLKEASVHKGRVAFLEQGEGEMRKERRKLARLARRQQPVLCTADSCWT